MENTRWLIIINYDQIVRSVKTTVYDQKNNMQ